MNKRHFWTAAEWKSLPKVIKYSLISGLEFTPFVCVFHSLSPFLEYNGACNYSLENWWISVDWVICLRRFFFSLLGDGLEVVKTFKMKNLLNHLHRARNIYCTKARRKRNMINLLLRVRRSWLCDFTSVTTIIHMNSILSKGEITTCFLLA